MPEHNDTHLNLVKLKLTTMTTNIWKHKPCDEN